ncbi:MAG: hypothetical protein LBB21_00885 [Holosporaceae bacterium]|jgi:hypothetical protein|nr:hypothetical protein [Holosporaceae bacterium]
MKLVEEIKNKTVITTKYVINNNSPIISVFYDEDGDWQFFGAEEVGEEDARIVSVQQILETDKTLANMPSLSKGQSAFRTSKESLWEVQN